MCIRDRGTTVAVRLVDRCVFFHPLYTFLSKVGKNVKHVLSLLDVVHRTNADDRVFAQRYIQFFGLVLIAVKKTYRCNTGMIRRAGYLVPT